MYIELVQNSWNEKCSARNRYQLCVNIYGINESAAERSVIQVFQHFLLQTVKTSNRQDWFAVQLDGCVFLFFGWCFFFAQTLQLHCVSGLACAVWRTLFMEKRVKDLKIRAVETESTFCSARLWLWTPFIWFRFFFSFPSMLNFNARKASWEEDKSNQSKTLLALKKKKCVHCSFSPSCKWWGDILAPAISLAVSLQAVS